MAKAKPYFRVSTKKPVVIPLGKLHQADLFFIEGECLYMLSLYRPGGVFILQEVNDPETLIKLGFMEEPVEEVIEEPVEEVIEEPVEEVVQEPEAYERKPPEGSWEPEDESPVESPPPNPEEPEPRELEESTKDLSSKLSTKLLGNVEEPEDEAV